MSADNIDICPSCGEPELREWYEWYNDNELVDDLPTTITASYSCHCRACDYTFEFQHTVAFPIKATT